MSRAFGKPSACFAALLACPAWVCAQKPNVIPLVPAANWRMSKSEPLGLDGVRSYGGDPVVDQEYGVKAVEHRTYQLGLASADVILETASDSSSAYGLYTFYQSEATPPLKSMDLTALGPVEALMARGRYFIRVPRPKRPSVSENDFRALLVFAAGTKPSQASIAGLPPAMPAAGLVPGTEKYMLGLEAAKRLLPSFRTDLIGFAQGAEMQMAEYQSGKNRSTMLAITYPTPQIARIRLGAMQNFLKVNEDQGPDGIYGRREGSFVFLVLKAGTNEVAKNLLDQFKVTEGVSWNERYPGDKPFGLQLFELILGNVLLCILLAGGGIFGGIIIALSRRFAAKWYPGSSWADPTEGSIIRLKLN